MTDTEEFLDWWEREGRKNPFMTRFETWMAGVEHGKRKENSEASSLKQATASDWKPIETSPDGVDVLLFNRDDGRMFVGSKNPKVLHSWNGVATHWRPLPDMPKEQP